jgi:hypothetical protein
MLTRLRTFILFTLIISLTACKDENETFINFNTALFGTWQFASYQEDAVIYERAEALPEEKGAFTFKQNGELFQRSIAGWCATPPLVYETVKGSWSKINGNTILIKTPGWDGTLEMTVEIVELTPDRLMIKYQYN